MRTEAAAPTREQAIRGAVAAAGAWFVGLAAATAAAGFVFGSRTLSAGALFFYNTHLVPLSPVGGVTDAGGNAVVQTLGTPGLASVLLPGLVLGVAGAVLAWRTGADSIRSAAVAGTYIAPGYFAFSVLGLVAFTGPLFGGVYRPSIPLAALLAGLVFPVVGGAVGGALGFGLGNAANRLRSRFL